MTRAPKRKPKPLGISAAAQLEAERAAGYAEGYGDGRLAGHEQGKTIGRQDARQEFLTELTLLLESLRSTRESYFFKGGVNQCIKEVEGLKARYL